MKKYIATIGAILLIAAASTAYALSVYYWNDPKVTGGGSIVGPTGGTATFGMVSQDGNGVSKKDGITYKGNIEYVDHNWQNGELNLHSDSIDPTVGLKCTKTLNSGALSLCTDASITGTATVNGVSGYTFTVNVEDHGEPVGTQATDEFYITITGPNSFSYIAGGVLTGGNIQIFGNAYYFTD